MRAALSIARVARAARVAPLRYAQVRFVSSEMRMPAMSPTMTEGGIATWKKKEGEAFAAGDVLLEIETDKATIDVEAQDDGVMAKILVGDGAKGVPVGEVIAILAEEGDDLSNIEVPKEEAKPKEESKEEPKEAAESKDESEAKPKGSDVAEPVHKELDHSKPMFPSVARLLLESDLTAEQISKIKPTGRHGMLTKGDVLAATGVISNPYGTAEKLATDPMMPGGRRASEPKVKGSVAGADGAAAKKPEPPLDGPALRRLIVQGLTKATAPISVPSAAAPAGSDAEFDDLLADYAPLLPATTAPAPAAPAADTSAPKNEFEGLI